MSLCPHCSAPLPATAQFCSQCGLALGSRPAAAPGKANKAIAIVVGCGCAMLALAVLGIVLAVLVPNFIDALHKGRQKRTLGDLRSIGVALDSYREVKQAEDPGHPLGYPVASSLAELEAKLVPDFLYSSHTADGWGHEMRYLCSGDPATGCATYWLVSPGRDGAFEHEAGEDYEQPTGFVSTDYDRDLVFSNGSLVQYPEAPARR